MWAIDNDVSHDPMMMSQSRMFAVQPVPFCPHLVDVQPLPSDQLDAKQPCAKCDDTSENWICLVCYQVSMITIVPYRWLVLRV